MLNTSPDGVLFSRLPVGLRKYEAVSFLPLQKYINKVKLLIRSTEGLVSHYKSKANLTTENTKSSLTCKEEKIKVWLEYLSKFQSFCSSCEEETGPWS